MKKNYFSTLFAALMLFLAMPATAQVASVTEFYGKWQFTADIDVKNQDYANLFSSSCEVVITKGDNGNPAKMTGFAGSTATLSINSFDAATQTLLLLNPNTPQLWSPLNMADADGKYPYGTAAGSYRDTYSSINFTYDAATKVLTYPDFTAVTVDHKAESAEIMVKVSNIKMTLIEAEEVVIPEIAGEWTYTPYYTRNDSTCFTTFKMILAAQDDTNTKWNATFVMDGVEEFTLPGTFDGVNLDIPFENLYIDKEKSIRFGIPATSDAPDNVFVKSGKFSFAYSTKTMMWQNDRIVIRQDSTEMKEGVETPVAPMVQQLWGGWIEREDPNAYDWAGVYNVNVYDLEDLELGDGIDFPKSFEMVIENVQGTYSIKKFLGYENTVMSLTPSEDGKSATIDLSNAYCYLQFIGEVKDGENTDYAYHVLTDANGQPTTLNIRINDDGSLSFGDFSVSHKLYYGNSYTPLALLSGVSATKAEAPKFAWIGDYTLTTGQLDKYYQGDDVEFPETFDVNIAYFDGSQYGMDSYYYISTFMNKNIGSTPIKLTIAEDGWSADMATGGMCGAIVGGETYYKIYDMNASANPITITGNEDGTISIPSFFIKVLNYNDNSEAAGAWYQNVTLTRKPEPVITLTAEVVEGTERTFEFASAVAGTVISIDWGNGEIVVADTLTEAYDGWNEKAVIGTPVGKGEIKIYATGDLCYFECVSKINEPGITKLDVSKATELTQLHANGNKLTSVDVSMLTKLETLYLNNNSLTEVKDLPASLTYLQLASNKLTSFDGSKLTAVTTLYLSDNNLGTLDVSDMSALKSLYALNCGLTSFTAGALTTPKAFINVNNNLLETLDLSEATGLGEGTLFAMGNNLTEVKFPDVEIKSANISKNKFTLATIPATAKVKTLTYWPQQDMVIEDIKETIDLSAQNNLVGLAADAQATVYTWLTEAGDTLVAGVDYTEEAGKFTFIKEQAQKVYCTMSTAAFPKFTGANIFKTVAVAVTASATGIDSMEASVELTGDIYAVDGKLIKRNASVADMPKGLYIVKTAAGKAIKVIRK